MGVNRVGFGIIDDEVVKEASKAEIIRRYFKTACEYKKGDVDKETFERVSLIMNELSLKEEDRKVVVKAREKAKKVKEQKDTNETVRAIALETEDGNIFTGKATEIMDETSAVVLNAVKHYANIDHEIHLISPLILEPIRCLKKENLAYKNAALNCEEILMALSICAATNPMAQVALSKLKNLKGAQAHSTTIISNNNEQTFRKLGIDITCDPEYPTENLYY